MKISPIEVNARKKVAVVATIIMIIIVVTAIFNIHDQSHYLIIKDGKNSNYITYYELQGDLEFSIAFKHSVNQSMVEDRYRIEKDKIVVYQTIYYNFGAGVQTQLREGEILRKGEDGAMIIDNINRVIPELGYNISPVYDHILKVNNENISLKEVCKNSRTIVIEYSTRKPKEKE